MPARNSITIVVAAIVSIACYQKATHDRYSSMLVHAMKVIEENYVEKVEREELFENAMIGLVGRLDQYSAYIGPTDLQLFQQSIDQEFVGIGIVVEGPPQTERLIVFTPVFDSPAHQVGMRAGDVILEIDGKSTDGLALTDAVKRIKGPAGTEVTLTIQHIGDEKSVTVDVKRDLIRTQSVLGDVRDAEGQWTYHLPQEPTVGYIRLTTFGEHTVEELSEVLRQTNGSVESMILDLRGNAGGLLDVAVDTCNMFIDHGMIVSIRGREQKIEAEYQADSSSTLFDQEIPMVVLVDRFSASASEIVAACLKDNQRAVVVGQRTWGKGTVQNVLPLDNGNSAMKLTTASYWRPNGKNIHRRLDASEDENWGVRPSDGFEVILDDDEFRRVMEYRRQRDILRDETDAETVPEQDQKPVIDSQLQKALEYLEPKTTKNAA